MGSGWVQMHIGTLFKKYWAAMYCVSSMNLACSTVKERWLRVAISARVATVKGYLNRKLHMLKLSQLLDA